MNKEFIKYEQALVLKELGFDEPCFRWYDERWGDDLQQDKFNTNKDLFMTDLDCSAPLYQQAFRWFREKHNYYVVISPSIDIRNVDFTVEINQFFPEDRYVGEGEDEEYFAWGLELVHIERFDTYEEAELECLVKLIEIVKNK